MLIMSPHNSIKGAFQLPNLNTFIIRIPAKRYTMITVAIWSFSLTVFDRLLKQQMRLTILSKII